MISRIFLTILLVASVIFIVQKGPASVKQPAPSRQSSSQPSSSGHRLADSMQAKLDHIQANGEQAHPDQAPTVMTEEEVNDYIAAGRIVLPQGVKKLKMEGRGGVVTAFLNVDFDEIRAGQNSFNPMLSIFSGQHDVQVEADASGSGREGSVHVRNVVIDGITVPKMALEYFVSKYITPKYPNVGIDSQFQLPNKIDIATVGYHKVTVTQK
ncbi:MAG TPA: hypothetical protein VE604_12390 [Candidatus Polarisedimenticolia bacterium]|jgi:hypothetical protein|nr:hypothetical protein [Candidatus Polarisedimenticolia bacterium]